MLDSFGGDIRVVGNMENNMLWSIAGEGEGMLTSLLEVLRMLSSLLEVLVLNLVLLEVLVMLLVLLEELLPSLQEVEVLVLDFKTGVVHRLIITTGCEVLVYFSFFNFT